jgi:hypothetical protein
VAAAAARRPGVRRSADDEPSPAGAGRVLISKAVRTVGELLITLGLILLLFVAYELWGTGD